MNKQTFAFLTALIFSMGSYAGSESASMGKININTATEQELADQLIGIGEKGAREIVKHRKEHGFFNSLEEFDEVKYVGNSVLEKNRDRIVFE